MKSIPNYIPYFYLSGLEAQMPKVKILMKNFSVFIYHW